MPGHLWFCYFDSCCRAGIAHTQLPLPPSDPPVPAGHVDRARPARAQQVGPLQREHVLRLLRAPAFTRQLAGVKQLSDLLSNTFYQAPLQQGIEVRALASCGPIPICTALLLSLLLVANRQ